MKTIVYIDGFNLYYRALRGTAHKWLNLLELARASLPANHQVTRVNLYTARVSANIDPGAPGRQATYLKALKNVPEIFIHYGRFLAHPHIAKLTTPPKFQPAYTPSSRVNLKFAEVWKNEEKGSDVALGAHLVRDAFTGQFDAAAIITNDTDLTEPMRIVAQEAGKPIILLTPSPKPAASLTQLAHSTRHIAPYLGACQFPNPIILPDGSKVHKPAGW
ncbi:NYN domain-containing protein [Geminicoccus roseus]|uniref:NYN domain-containing protein n=1 Tax=Geminicoccus roseus TaxID=404900 RepID=UPI000A043CEC|nr:NYN domain-containing protein [Geminicoccus roseus]